MEDVWSHPNWVTPIATQWVPVLQEDEIYHASNHDDEEYIAGNAADEEYIAGNAADLGDSRGDNMSEPEIVAMKKMMEVQLENPFHMVNWDRFKYRPLDWAPFVDVYAIAVP